MGASERKAVHKSRTKSEVAADCICEGKKRRGALVTPGTIHKERDPIQPAETAQGKEREWQIMYNELDLVGMFEGLSITEAKELTARIRSAVLNEYQSFQKEKGILPLKIREPIQPGKQAKHNQRLRGSIS
jgi:hypothetical protein